MKDELEKEMLNNSSVEKGITSTSGLEHFEVRLDTHGSGRISSDYRYLSTFKLQYMHLNRTKKQSQKSMASQS